MKLFLRGLFFWAVLAFGSLAQAGQVTVYAAASLKTALDDVAQLFAEETGHRVVLSYAGSSTVARHIVQGAPFDLVMTASSDWMDYIEEMGQLTPESRVNLLTNQLVLVTPKSGGAEPPRRVAMALVEAVPAGIYGKAALIHQGLWDELASIVVQTDNVRAALRLVAMAEADLGVVYASDAMAEPDVEVLRVFPPESHPPIRYPLGIVAGQTRDEVRALAAFLASPPAQKIFAAHGFQPLIGAAQ